MKAIFEQALWPRLAARFANQAFAERTIPTDCYDETVLTPAVDAVAGRHPRVYVKSRAQVYGGGVADFVTLAARAASATAASQLLDAAEADLRSELARVGVQAFGRA
jgi:molybdopterin-biosynthesis enzyme MoeA-like protein